LNNLKFKQNRREQLVEYPSCERANCINWKEGRCSLKNPEANNGSCLDFEEAMDYLRLEADAIKGTLG
jgi:hypothetical protein